MRLYLYSDANTDRTNPGPCGIGVVVLDADGNRLARRSRHIGQATNNVGEWTALIEALKVAQSLPEWESATAIFFFTDSELVQRQATGRYHCHSPKLAPLVSEWKQLAAQIGKPFAVTWIPREENEAAHDAAEEAFKGLAS